MYSLLTMEITKLTLSACRPAEFQQPRSRVGAEEARVDTLVSNSESSQIPETLLGGSSGAS